jgi:hypothetical protein
MTGWSQYDASLAANMRAATSTVAPGENGTTSRTGLVGNSLAAANHWGNAATMRTGKKQAKYKYRSFILTSRPSDPAGLCGLESPDRVLRCVSNDSAQVQSVTQAVDLIPFGLREQDPTDDHSRRE